MPILLIIAIAALVLGPFFAQILRRSRPVNQMLDGFVLVSVSGLAMLHLLPEAILTIHWGALVMLVIGALLPSLIEHRFRAVEEKAHIGVILLVLAGILVHTTLDGMALSEMSIEHGAGQALAIAVVLHRLPIGILVWWSARSAYGKRGGIFTLSIMAIFTLIGFWLGDNQFSFFNLPVVSYLQALITGSLLHVILHRPYYQEAFHQDHHEVQRWQVWSGLGALMGITLLILMPHDAHGESHELIERFIDTAKGLYLASAPALLVGFAGAALLGLVLPQAAFGWLNHGNRSNQISRGILFGLPLPICSCGVVPLYQTLVKKGVPMGAGIAFLIATPELGLDAVLISYPLLGGAMLVARLITAFIIAFGVAWILDRFAVKTVPGHSNDPLNHLAPVSVANPKPKMKFSQFWHTLNYELIDEIGPWLIFGILLAAAAQPLLDLVQWATFPDWAAVLLMTLFGFPIYVCATGATPLGAVMLAAGVAPGAVLAFLITGPASNITTLGVLSRLHGRRTMWLFLITIILLTWVIGMLVNWVMPTELLPTSTIFTEDNTTWYQWVAGGILGILFLASLFRIGPRAMVQTLLSVADDDDDHGHGHGH